MRQSTTALIALSLLTVGLAGSANAQVLRRFNSLTAVPDYAYTNRTQTISLMAAIEPNAELIKTSITLVELAPDGRALRTLGQMYDDGTHGDAIANDYTYTRQIQLFEVLETTRRFKASAAYQRTITRIQSPEAQIRFAAAAFAEPPDAGSLVKDGELAEFPVNELMVEIAKGVDLYTTGTALATLTGGRVAGQIPSIRRVLLKYSSVKTSAELTQREAALKANSNVVSVVRNYVFVPDTLSNDMTDLRTASSSRVAAFERVKAFEAWEFLDGMKDKVLPCDPSTASCERTVIGVIDTGVRATHREFGGVPITAMSTGADSDSNGHGTSVAGIIAARNHRTSTNSAAAGHMNGVVAGVPGATGGSRVSYSLAVGGNSGTMATVLANIENAIAGSARVINMSFGWNRASTRTDDAWRQSTVAKLNDSAFTTGRQSFKDLFDSHSNVTFVASAGNYDYDSSNHFPGGIEGTNIITVGAIGISGADDGQRAVWGTMGCTGASCTTGLAASCFGASVDIAAPGELIYAPDKDADDDYRADFNGTSGATPFVTGTAALLLALRPSLKPGDLMQILKETADPLTSDHPIGNLLNTYAAVLYVARPVDIFLLTDMTGSFYDDLVTFKAQASGLIDELAVSGLDSYVGLARFEDYPISPYGDLGYGDGAYSRVLDLIPLRKWDADAAQNKATLLNAVNSLYTKNGLDWPESQLPALYQSSTGAGQVIAPGSPANIPAGQQANFRPNSLRIIILWTDAPFHEGAPYPGPSWTQTLAALNDKSIKVIGILAGSDGGAQAHLSQVAQGTATLAGKSGVDCNGDGSADLAENSPLVCSISTNGSGIRQAIVNSIISLAK